MARARSSQGTPSTTATRGGGLSLELDAFLDGGEPPIVFTLGSLVARAGHSYYRAYGEIARRLGRRAVLLAHEDDLPALAEAGAPDVCVAPYSPHSLVFPRACAIVHHGGIGTTGQALRSGRPQLVTPFLGDQFDNAERLQRLGVARIVDGKTAAPDAIWRELGNLDHDHASRAARVGEKVRQEDGAAAAALRIAALFAEEGPLKEEGADLCAAQSF